ncbi:DUF89 family protein [Candidatus Fermentibacteria bacterium]|nr:DUF89 family protein [Candidatus Fermentibacteria bacterium]
MTFRADIRCVDCFDKGLWSFVERGGLDEQRSREVFERARNMVLPRLKSYPPPIAGATAYVFLRETFQGRDIFARDKRIFTSSLLEELPRISANLRKHSAPESEALKASAWGNMLDVGQGKPLPDLQELTELLYRPMRMDDVRSFLEKLSGASTLLILGDNAGETVLDRLFLEIARPRADVYYTVRPQPVMNDATGKDARHASLHRFSTLVNTGLDAPTVHPDLVDDKLRNLFKSADLILSKGQGNLEGLMGIRDPRLYFSFVVKCPLMSEVTGFPEGQAVFASSMELG